MILKYILLSFILYKTGVDGACNLVAEVLVCLHTNEEAFIKTEEPRIEWLVIHNSTFPTLKNSLLKYIPKVQKIFADNVSIETIEKDAFQNLNSLSKIDVSLNKIQVIDVNLIKNLKSIDIFIISFNKNLNLPENKPFLSSNTLRTLVLNSCEIKQVYKETFENLPNLRNLELSNNKLENFPKGAFQNLNSSTKIDVSLNKIQFIDVNLIKNLESIDIFNVSFNKNLNLPENKPFLSSDTLTTLVLNFCEIKQVYKETFENLPSLGNLELSNNQLENFPAKTFTKINLLSLDITGNRIKSMSPDIFEIGTPLVIFLENNPWNCDCKLTPLIEWAKEKINEGNVSCKEPVEKAWLDIKNPVHCTN